MLGECEMCYEPGELKLIDGMYMCVACESVYLADMSIETKEGYILAED